MQDAITSVINSSTSRQVPGHLGYGEAKRLLQTGELRVRAATTISSNAAAIVKEAVAKSLHSDITCPGGNMYTTVAMLPVFKDLDHLLAPFYPCTLAGDLHSG